MNTPASSANVLERLVAQRHVARLFGIEPNSVISSR